jgi:hypothetical protein
MGRIRIRIGNRGTGGNRPWRRILTVLWIGTAGLGVPAISQAQEWIVEGLWGSTATTPDHPSWRIEDRMFQAGPRFGYDYLKSLLSDRANDERPLTELVAETRTNMLAHARSLALVPSDPAGPAPAPNDPATGCEPLDLGRILAGPRPFSVDVDAGEVVIRHEEQNTVRHIPLGTSSEAVGTPSRLGTAIAWFEGDTLVVESTGIVPMSIPIGVTTTSALRIVERYAPDQSDINRLEFEVTFDDPGVLREPLVLISPRVRIEGQVFVDSPCESISRELESDGAEP